MKRETHADAIRAVLRKARKPLLFEQLHMRVENRLQQVIGRNRLYVHLGMMQTAGEIKTAGRAFLRTYALRRPA